MTEVWKPLQVKGFEDRYLISNTGLIKTKEGKIRKLTTVQRRHVRVTLYSKDKVSSYIVKKLVALHFIPNPLNLDTVVNIDGNIDNNATYNLIWGKKVIWNSGLKEVVENTLAFKVKVEIRRHGGREQLLKDMSKKECADALTNMFAKYDYNDKVEQGNILEILCPEKKSNYTQAEIESAIYAKKFRKQKLKLPIMKIT